MEIRFVSEDRPTEFATQTGGFVRGAHSPDAGSRSGWSIDLEASGPE